jgi:hypothetical protein
MGSGSVDSQGRKNDQRKRRKWEEIAFFTVLDVLFGGLEVSSVA